MKMKKLIGIMLAGAVAVSMTACGSTGGAPETGAASEAGGSTGADSTGGGRRR